LFNGDIGIVWHQDGLWSVAFMDENRQIQFFLVDQLQGISSAFAITVHKSQGSEYDEVAFSLPDLSSPLLTRELVYTAVTRAKSKVLIYASMPELESALYQSTLRQTFLKDRLIENH
ncbi:MAG: ATP-binding domain-containing protein, partial [Cellvibrionales bacterium]|nr:ATP-binding domain-containing protein [Cellvibrionales bacterium]